MIKKFIIVLFIFALSGCLYSEAFAGNSNNKISNGYFSFTMPAQIDGTYIVKKKNNRISIIETISAKAGEGGFAFGFNIFKSPNDYANLEGYRKIGELTDKKGIIYDVVLERPVENICSDEDTALENFIKLYELAENIEIKGVNGSVYNKNKGMKGEELYKEILGKYKKAIKEHWDYTKIKQENIEISRLLQEKKNTSIKKVGYTYYDVNSDGIDELFIGEIGKNTGKIYDVYTMINRKPAHVLSRNNPEDKYFVCNDNYICKNSPITKDKNVFSVLTLEKNSIKRTLLVEYLYDKCLNKENPWFRTYLPDGHYERISAEIYNQGINAFNDYKKLDYIPLSKFDNE